MNKFMLSGVLLAVSSVVPSAYSDSESEHEHHDEAHHESEYREHGKHVHGLGELNIAMEGDLLELEWVNPSFNLLGFPGMGKTDEQKRLLAETLIKLKGEEGLFVMNSEAGCVLEDENISVNSVDEAHEDHGHEAHGAEEHAEFVANYEYVCANPEQLKEIVVGVHEQFPLVEKTEVQVITESTQTSLTLDANNNKVTF